MPSKRIEVEIEFDKYTITGSVLVDEASTAYGDVSISSHDIESTDWLSNNLLEIEDAIMEAAQGVSINSRLNDYDRGWEKFDDEDAFGAEEFEDNSDDFKGIWD